MSDILNRGKVSEQDQLTLWLVSAPVFALAWLAPEDVDVALITHRYWVLSNSDEYQAPFTEYTWGVRALAPLVGIANAVAGPDLHVDVVVPDHYRRVR